MGLRQPPTPQPETVIHLRNQAVPQLTPVCPTAPLLSSSAARAGGRKTKNAPFVSSQDQSPPCCGAPSSALCPVTFLPSWGPVSPPEPGAMVYPVHTHLALRGQLLRGQGTGSQGVGSVLWSSPSPSDPSGCFSAICEGPDACREDEVCVKPGFCRCKPGFFGAQCNSRES